MFDLSADLAGVVARTEAFPLPHGRGDEFARASTPDARGAPPPRADDIYITDLHPNAIR